MQNRSVSSRRPGAGTAYRPQASPPTRQASTSSSSRDPRAFTSTKSKHRGATTCCMTPTQRFLVGATILLVAYFCFSVYSFGVIHQGIGGEPQPPTISTTNTAGRGQDLADQPRDQRDTIQKAHITGKDRGSRSSKQLDLAQAATDDHHKGQALMHGNNNLADAPTVAAQPSSHVEFQFDKSKAEDALKQYGATSIFKPITAYIEPPMDDIIPGTGSRGDMKNDKDKGIPPEFRIPLPLRTQSPNNLQKVVYNKVQSCRDMPGRFPIDRGLEMDANGNVVVWNVADEETPDDFAQQELPHCPVESDPWLPWIHDVFPSQDGCRIEFVTQNKRRCRTGSKYTKDVNRLIPQVALMQPISVERISEDNARELAPELWYPSERAHAPRYRLAPHNESSPDGMFTRFICRFHTTSFASNTLPQTIYLGETLSQYPFNYELVSYRKNQDAMLSAKGKDTIYFWTSNIRFNCPVPTQNELPGRIANGDFVLSDGTPTVYVDLVPIRTSVRFDEHMLTEEQIGPMHKWGVKGFDAAERWGAQNVVPHIEASGRWENIPICLPPHLSDGRGNTKLVPDVFEKPQKPHYLSACVWASAEFKTRGASRASDIISDTFARMHEWIEFHLLVGFEQIYLYDNSGAQTNETSLKEVADRFPGKVTYINWPSIICNNNIPAHDNTGERSSQYAAENSCRTRYGPFTEWIASFDTDEYLVPMGSHSSLKGVLLEAAKGGTNILTFRSTRAKLRQEACHSTDHGTSLRKRDDIPFLEAYNCDPEGLPKPSWAERARKQIYRPSYVHYHFVHYSTVPDSILVTYAESKRRNGTEWRLRRHEERSPSERVTDEVNEALMVHAKSIKVDQTSRWKTHCHKDYDKKWLGCWIAVPWPNNTKAKDEGAYDKDGLLYNCFVNERVEEYWLPKLKKALEERRKVETIAREKG